MIRAIILIVPLIFVCFPESYLADEQRFSPNSHEIVKNGTSKALALVGNFGSKFYFTETSHMSWETADTFCKANNMELVTLRSSTERDYLLDKRDELSVQPQALRWWTSARNVHRYEWADGSNVEIDVGVYEGVKGCVLIAWNGVYEDPCNGSLWTYHPLCEIIEV